MLILILATIIVCISLFGGQTGFPVFSFRIVNLAMGITFLYIGLKLNNFFGILCFIVSAMSFLVALLGRFDPDKFGINIIRTSDKIVDWWVNLKL